MLKKFIPMVLGVAAALFASAFILSCANSIENNNSALIGLMLSNSPKEEYGSLTINSAASRALNIADISYVYASVEGTGISSPVRAQSEKIENGLGKGSVTIEKIPVGKNRIVTVFAYDSSNNKLGTVMLRGVTDIAKGNNNSVDIDKSTTLLGNVFWELLSAGVNLADVNKGDITAKLSSATNSWALYNAAAIASDYQNTSGINNDITKYELKPGLISFTSYYDECTVQVGDPVSSIKIGVAKGEGTVTGIAPGTWPVYVTNKDGELLKKTYATVTAGTESDIGYLGTVTDRIVIHAKYTHVWAWKTGNESDNLTGGEWPGTAMTAELNDWYVYSFEKGITSVDVVLSNNGSSKHRETGGDTLTTGEWWYEDGEWYDSNPADSEPPVLESFTSSSTGTVAGEVTFSFTASDNKCLKNAVITLDSQKLKVIELSGTNSTQSCILDTSDYSNGIHVVSCVVYDKEGNVSAAKSISLTFKNQNKIPVAVITGISTFLVNSIVLARVSSALSIKPRTPEGISSDE